MERPGLQIENISRTTLRQNASVSIAGINSTTGRVPPPSKGESVPAVSEPDQRNLFYLTPTIRVQLRAMEPEPKKRGNTKI
jgi:hypothetical protein